MSDTNTNTNTNTKDVRTSKPASRPVSDRQLAANRKNATRSSGPRTKAGKARASRNATSHGLYAKGHQAIGGGQFAEDEGEIKDFTDAIVEGLEPRDALEVAAAHQVASAFLWSQRLDQFQRAAVQGDSILPPEIIDRHPDAEFLRREAELVRVMMEITVNSWCDLDEDIEWSVPKGSRIITFEDLAEYVGVSAGDVCRAPGVWDVEHTPTTHREWREAYVALLQSLFASPDDAQVWFLQRYREHMAECSCEMAEADGIAAQRIFHSSLEMALRHGARIDRSLDRALARYDKLRARNLGEEDPSADPAVDDDLEDHDDM